MAIEVPSGLRGNPMIHSQRIQSKGGEMKGTKESERRSTVICAIALFVVAAIALPVPGKNIFTRTLLYRPFYPGRSAKGIAFLDSMKAFGYNGWLVDSKLITTPKTAKPEHLLDFQRFVAHAEALGITLIPMSHHMAEPSHTDMNHAEAYPTRGSRFIVDAAGARFDPDPTTIKNPGFELSRTGWTGSGLFEIDNAVKRSGTASIRVKDPVAKNQEISQSGIMVKPYTTYELSVWIKTKDFTQPREVGMTVFGLHRTREQRGVFKNQDWRLSRISFNTLERTEIKISLVASAFYKSTGEAWFDDVAIREVALYETVIRNTTVPVVKSTDGTILREGRDYTLAVDAQVRKYNEGRLLLTENSPVKIGDTIFVDWYKLANGMHGIPSASLSDAGVWNLFDEHVRLVDDMFDQPVGRHMKYSEWRVGGWDPATQQQFKSFGAYYAWVIQQTERQFRQSNWNREVYIFNDDVDPYHNGERNAGMFWNGNHGNWKGLSDETVVINWCGWADERREKSMRFFAGMDPRFPEKKTVQRQIISGASFNPSDGNGSWNDWLPRIEKLENDPDNPLPDGSIIGVFYHTFRFNFTEMELMKNVCEKAGRWEPEFPFKPRDVGIASAVVSPAPMALTLQVRNPVRATQNIEYGIQYDGYVELKLLNSLGRTTVTLVNHKRRNAGKHRVNLDVSRVPAGVYFVYLNVDRGAAKMMKKVAVF